MPCCERCGGPIHVGSHENALKECRDRLANQLQRTTFMWEMADAVTKRQAEVIRKARPFIIALEKKALEIKNQLQELQARDQIYREFVTSVKVYVESCNDTGLREELRLALDLVPWHLEDFEHYVSETEILHNCRSRR